MEFDSPICPQCGAPLSRQALWRTINCGHCGVVVTRAEAVVLAQRFHEAFQRASSSGPTGASTITCAGQRYQVSHSLGYGPNAQLFLGQRLGPAAECVVIKRGHIAMPPGHLQREMLALAELQADTSAGAAYFSQRLPQPVWAGEADDGKPTLLLRHPAGYWGSLADVCPHYPNGIDPRHTVWMWRRVLEVLAYVHAAGWCHGRLAPEHLLVQPGDHGILIIGWAHAQASSEAAIVRDLMQSAWSMRALLATGDGEPAIPPQVPAALARLLEQASADAVWLARLGARGLEQALTVAARTAFGTPQFLPFSPTQAR